jgi:hypothetical protein
VALFPLFLCALAFRLVLQRERRLPGRELHHRRSMSDWNRTDGTPGETNAKNPSVARGALWSELVTM